MYPASCSASSSLPTSRPARSDSAAFGCGPRAKSKSVVLPTSDSARCKFPSSSKHGWRCGSSRFNTEPTWEVLTTTRSRQVTGAHPQQRAQSGGRRPSGPLRRFDRTTAYLLMPEPCFTKECRLWVGRPALLRINEPGCPPNGTLRELVLGGGLAVKIARGAASRLPISEFGSGGYRRRLPSRSRR